MKLELTKEEVEMCIAALDGMYLTRVNELDRMKAVFSDNERDVILDAANRFWNLSTKINNQLL